MTTATYGSLSASEHDAQLRKAIVASTIGTAIEWYDFFLYGTAAGLIFGKLFFPNEDPLTACLRYLFHRFRWTAYRCCNFRPLRRPHWSQGDAYRYAFVDGHRDGPYCTRAHLRVDRYLGCRYFDCPAYASRHRCGRRMGRLSTSGHGVVKDPRPSRVRCLVAAIRRALRSVPVKPRGAGF
jgi:hypothetical protein